MYCTNCGNEIKENVKFCVHCGNALTTQETQSIVVEQQTEIEKKANTMVRPWVRYFARYTDYMGLAFSMGIFMEMLYPTGIISQEIYDSFYDTPDIVLGIFLIGMWIFIEPIFLSSWGTTPGKWLFKTTVRTLDGNKLTFPQAFKRSVSVSIKGFALGIPLLSLITNLIAYDNITSNGYASWDEGNFAVQHEKIGAIRVGLIIILLIVFISLILLGSYE